MRNVSTIALLAVAMVAILATTTRYHRVHLHEPGEAARPVEVLAGQYVASTACKACHPIEYATWHASYHHTMTQKAAPGAVIGRFDGSEIATEGYIYKVEHQGDDYWVEIRSALDPPGTAGIKRTILMTTGSHHQQIYWADSGIGRALELLPLLWNVQEQRWRTRDALFLRPPKTVDALSNPAPGEWSKNCNRCHSTFPRPRVTEPFLKVDTQVVEFGIACEECHGPGDHHVQVNMDPIRRFREYTNNSPDSTIVQPMRLSHRRSSEVCGQCHAVSLRGRAETAHWNTQGFSFEPGGDLEATQTLVHKGDDTPLLRSAVKEVPSFVDMMFWPDGVVCAAGREYSGMQTAPCFERGTMSCMSCHQMHERPGDARPRAEWTEDQLKPGMRGNNACIQCHPKFNDEARLTAHTHHKAASSGSNCYNCHMPFTTWALSKAVRNHHIDSPVAQSSTLTERPNACNLCHLDKTLEWTATSLFDWYKTPKPELTAADRSIAAGVRWAVSGDARQRVFVAWCMGWPDAQEASGTAWMAPYFAQLLEDPYDLVRFVAQRSLRTVPGSVTIGYDFMDPPAARARATGLLRQSWRRDGAPAAARHAALLVDAEGRLMDAAFLQLLNQRENRDVILGE